MKLLEKTVSPLLSLLTMFSSIKCLKKSMTAGFLAFKLTKVMTNVSPHWETTLKWDTFSKAGEAFPLLDGFKIAYEINFPRVWEIVHCTLCAYCVHIIVQFTLDTLLYSSHCTLYNVPLWSPVGGVHITLYTVH